MGIKGLMKVINDHAANATKEQTLKNYFGRIIAIDASMCLYQFLIAVRTGYSSQNLTNENGEVTSHLQGMFYRTIRLMNNGIKPVYVFDGKPPDLKSFELEKRTERREKAEKDMKEAKENEDQEAINKYQQRLVKVTKEHNEDVKKLLRLMGVPVIEASGEAEAQCAALCRAGKVYATATEDMDALTFNTKRLVRHMFFAEARKVPIVEIDTDIVIEELGFTFDEFIELCILLGCDYTENIKGIGPVKALKLMKQHKSIEKMISTLDKKKYPVDENNFLFREAKKLFKEPDVTPVDNIKLEWKKPDVNGLVEFLCREKGFNEERIRSNATKLIKARKKGTQKRLDQFFTTTTVKRKKVDAKSSKNSKKNNKKMKIKKK